MSGPNDSSHGEFPFGELKLPALNLMGSRPVSDRYRLHYIADPLRLEWRPVGSSGAPDGRSANPSFEERLAAIHGTEQYIRDGGLLFDMQHPRLDLIDKAFLEAPLEPPKYLPSFTEIKVAQDNHFYNQIGGSMHLIGTPATPAQLLTPPGIGASVTSPYFKQPEPGPIGSDPPTVKNGSIGDVIKAMMGVKPFQDLVIKVRDEGLRQVKFAEADFLNQSQLGRAAEVSLAITLPATLLYGLVRSSDASLAAFNLIKGVDMPMAPAIGLGLRIDDVGAGGPILASRPPALRQLPDVSVSLTLSVPKLVDAILKLRQFRRSI